MNEINPTREDLSKQFRIDGTRITDDHLPEAIKEDMKLFYLALQAIHMMGYIPAEDGPHEEDLDTVRTQWFDLQGKINKALEFAELAQYATGFDIPESAKFEYIDLGALNGREKQPA